MYTRCKKNDVSSFFRIIFYPFELPSLWFQKWQQVYAIVAVYINNSLDRILHFEKFFLDPETDICQYNRRAFFLLYLKRQ